ncbi:hypothetical protein RIR_jg23666.t1 [Rhizophagus irregularis DAOM 181602=DAOM 197198]|nr:hypothetical protein RIR_jg23666.t1 [Rhizophagus irregularis DAOM 181602=DAOM 197198]
MRNVMINRIKKLIRCWNPSGTVLNEKEVGTLCGRENPQFEKSKLLSDVKTSSLYILYTLRCWILEFLITAILLE